MKSKFYLALFLFMFQKSFAQEVNSSGIVPISVPIYTLKDGNLELPMDLSYNSSGIKAPDKSGNVGLGWNLNVGAKIIRVTKDKPDEAFLGLDNKTIDPCGTTWHFWGYKNSTFPTFTEGNTQRFYFMKDLEPDQYYLYFKGKVIPFVVTTGGVEKNGQRIILLNESEDIFIEFLEEEYNFLQNPVAASPTYEYEIDNLIHTFPKRLKERTCNSGYSPFAAYKPNLSFKVSDTDGDVYYFGLDVSSREYSFTESTLLSSNYLYTNGQDEKKEVHTVAGTIICSPAAWLLSKVTKPKGQIRPFNNYKTEDKFQEINFTYNRAISVNQTLFFQNPQTQDITDETSCVVSYRHYPTTYTNRNHSIYLEAQLKTIESDNFQVKFNATELFNLGTKITNFNALIPDYVSGNFTNTNREDLEGPEYLPAEVQRNTDNLFNLSVRMNNPIKNIRKSEMIKNILVFDKITNKQLGFYLDHSYFVESDVFNNDMGGRVNSRLKLNGLYPIEIGINTAKLITGYTFNYFPGFLGRYDSGTTDYWGYFRNIKQDWIGYYGNFANVRNKQTMAMITSCEIIRNPDINFAKAATLNQIKYPEGGIVEYDYELHKADNYYNTKSSTGSKSGFKDIGGLRIKSILTLDPVTNLKTIKRFSYQKFLNSIEPSGFLSIWPNSDYNDLSRVPSTTPTTGIAFTDPANASFKFVPDRSYNTFLYENLLASKFINGNYITYREIKVEEFGYAGLTEVSNGYTIYEFNINEKQPYAILQNGQFRYDVDNPAVFGTCYSAYRYFDWNYPTYDFTKGYLKKISIYKSGSNLPLSSTEYNYNVTDLTNIYNVKSAFLMPNLDIDMNMTGSYKGQVIVQVGIGAANFIPGVGQIISNVLSLIESAATYFIPFMDNTVYVSSTKNRIKQYNLPISNVKISSIKNTKFDLNGSLPIETLSTYNYGTNHNEPITIKSITKNISPTYPGSIAQEVVEENVKYLRDYTTTSATSNEGLALKNMRDRRYNVPIEMIKKKNNLVIQGSYVEFQNDLNFTGLPKTLHLLELANPLSTFTLSNLTTTVTKNANFRPSFQFKQYNSKGLPTVYSLNKGPETTINYSYNDILPIGTIEASNFPSISKLTLYSYDSPLFGIKRVSYPDGNSENIEYDNLGRMKLLKDKDNNLRKSISYNYSNKTYPNLIPNIILQKISGTVFIDIKTLTDNDSYPAVNTEIYNLKITAPVGSKSIVVALENQHVQKVNFVNNSNTAILYVPIQPLLPTDNVSDMLSKRAGFWGVAGPTGIQQKIGLCKVKVQMFSDIDGKGDLVGSRNLTFYLY